MICKDGALILEIDLTNIEVVRKNTMETEIQDVTPTKEIQVVVPSEGKALSRVTVFGVNADIDENIRPENIRKGVEILGVEGNCEIDKPDQDKDCTPSETAQEITADTGYELARVNVAAIPSDYVGSAIPRISAQEVRPTTETQVIAEQGSYLEGDITLVGTNIQEKSATPTEEEQEITPDEGYSAISKVTIGAIDSEYVGSAIEQVNGKRIKPNDQEQIAISAKSYAKGDIVVEPVLYQPKQVTPTEEAQNIQPDTGYDAISEVEVEAIPNDYLGSAIPQVDGGAIEPTESAQTIVESGSYVKNDITLRALQFENKNVTPTKETQTIEAQEGYDGLKIVEVGAIPDEFVDTSDANATAENIANGKTAYVNGEKIVGTLAATASNDIDLMLDGVYYGMPDYLVEQILAGSYIVE